MFKHTYTRREVQAFQVINNAPLKTSFFKFSFHPPVSCFLFRPAYAFLTPPPEASPLSSGFCIWAGQGFHDHL